MSARALVGSSGPFHFDFVTRIGATQAVIFQFAGILYSRYGQHAFLGMTVISAIGLVCIVMLARRWNGGLVVPAL